jgi:hypothetical protein
MSIETDMAAAVTELKAAQETHSLALEQVGRARSEECTCLKRLNTAQKELDKLVALLHQRPSPGSEWSRLQITGYPISQ